MKWYGLEGEPLSGLIAVVERRPNHALHYKGCGEKAVALERLESLDG